MRRRRNASQFPNSFRLLIADEFYHKTNKGANRGFGIAYLLQGPCSITVWPEVTHLKKETFRILLLDDDTRHLDEVRMYLEREGYEVFLADTVSAAQKVLEKREAEKQEGEQAIDFAIVDLFLAGDAGDNLSNEFIRDSLIPAGIPYGRMSSAPYAVPPGYKGLWVLDKRHFWRQPQLLGDALIETLAELGW